MTLCFSQLLKNQGLCLLQCVQAFNLTQKMLPNESVRHIKKSKQMLFLMLNYLICKQGITLY